MNQRNTTAIILRRTDYGEADRIISVLTPDQGKLRLMARGVRRVKSKLAGGIELFSVSHITYIQGRGEIGTLISTRLDSHYGTIIKDLERVQLGYELIKRLDKVTEDQADAEYFSLLQQGFEALDEASVSVDLIRQWFLAQLLQLDGHEPNLQSDTGGKRLEATQTYNFDIEAMTFAPHPSGRFAAADIKFLRLLFSKTQPTVLSKIAGLTELSARANPLVTAMSQQYIQNM
ncbi:DNA repair protein RecO [Aeromicrobium sp.]|nr:DNA repair protein RecO [Candidatus Saccharibacteria bacterium]